MPNFTNYSGKNMIPGSYHWTLLALSSVLSFHPLNSLNAINLRPVFLAKSYLYKLPASYLGNIRSNQPMIVERSRKNAQASDSGICLFSGIDLL